MLWCYGLILINLNTSNDTVNAQIAVINAAYQSTGLKFNLKEVTRNLDATLFQNVGPAKSVVILTRPFLPFV
jgi:hypothetical protein